MQSGSRGDILFLEYAFLCVSNHICMLPKESVSYLHSMTLYDYSLTRRLPTTQSKLEPGFMDSISPGCTNIIIICLIIIITFFPSAKNYVSFERGHCETPHSSLHLLLSCSVNFDRTIAPAAISRYWETLIDKVHSLNATKSSSHFPWCPCSTYTYIYIWAILPRKLLMGRLVNRLPCHTNAQMLWHI